MPSTEFRDEVVDLALETLWSLWAELSVSGWSRRHSSTAIDLEPLILFTSWLGQYDARLRDESIDWCVTNARLVSGARLRNLLRHTSAEVRRSFDDYSATVKSHVRVAWPGSGTAWPMVPSGKSGVADLKRPALIQLTLRAICGVSARAEVLKLLVSGLDREWSTAKLAEQAAYGKDNVAAALDLLASAGLVDEARVGNSFRYTLRREGALRSLVGVVPGRFPRWEPVFATMEVLVRFAQADPSTVRADARAVGAARALRDVQVWLKMIGLADSVPTAVGPALNHQFDAWSIRIMRGWANVVDPAAAEVGGGDEALYTVNRLTLPHGAWMGVVINPGEPASALVLPEWAELYREAPRSDAIISDNSTGAPRLAHEIIRLAEARRGTDIGDYRGGDHDTNQLVAQAFAREHLWPMRPGTSMTWGENFLRAWRRDRVERLRATRSADR
jgi:hypothetical protein